MHPAKICAALTASSAVFFFENEILMEDRASSLDNPIADKT